MKAIYTTPKLSKAASGWFVWIRYNGKQKMFKAGLNRIKDLKLREREAKFLIESLKEKLASGWSPFGNPVKQNYLLPDALIFALEKKKDRVAHKTYLGYKSNLGFVLKAIKRLTLQYHDVTAVKRSHIRLILDDIKKSRNWSNKAYNKGRDYLKAIFSELVDWDIIENNPAFKIKPLKELRTNANRPPTSEEHQKIKKHLSLSYPNFYKYVATLFHTGIRPNELRQITIGMIDLHRLQIVLPPEITKTDIERIVPINPHLLELLMDMEVQFHPKEFYLFGAFNYNHKHRSSKGLDFIPGPNLIKRGTATKRWLKSVKKELGLSVNLYAMKHAGADAKILAGVGLESLQELYGHTSKVTTAIYAKKVKEVYRQEIIDKSPDF